MDLPFDTSINCELFFKKTKSTSRLAALTQVVSEKAFPSILGGNDSQAEDNRFSVWAANPKEVFQFNSEEQDPFEKLQEVLNKYKLEGQNELPEGMFGCGWIGFFSYDLGKYIERLPESARDDLKLPLIRLAFYDRAICYDHKDKQWYLIAIQLEDDSESAGEKLQGLSELLEQAEGVTSERVPEGDIQQVDLNTFKCNMSREYYFKALDRTKKYIYDGDVYQINFSQRFEADFDGDAIDLYHWQNECNPSPYAAFIDAGEFSIVSASPEMFIKVCDGVISTKPIKGTRPRVAGVANARQINEANFAELVQSEKDQAELNMIVDLERNDIAKVCKAGTRFVSKPRTIEEYPTVFHAVATVQGELKDADLPSVMCDVLKAVFPGGSITGAPKIRSMEIIDELEPTQRSVYTGSIGFIGVDGNVCLNIAIRTVIISDGKAYAQTGGGIVADSDPQEEWDETITKARALLAGITAVNNKALKK